MNVCSVMYSDGSIEPQPIPLKINNKRVVSTAAAAIARANETESVDFVFHYFEPEVYGYFSGPDSIDEDTGSQLIPKVKLTTDEVEAVHVYHAHKKKASLEPLCRCIVYLRRIEARLKRSLEETKDKTQKTFFSHAIAAVAIAIEEDLGNKTSSYLTNIEECVKEISNREASCGF